MQGSRSLAALALVGAAACHVKTEAFKCARSEQCVDGAGRHGFCEVESYCSFGDDQCESRRRFGTYAGPLSGRCVEPRGGGGDAGASFVDAGADAGADAGLDGGDGGAPAAREFTESFKWKGPHAAILVGADGGAAIGNTVFWNPDSWDTRTGMSVQARFGLSTIDVRKAGESSADGAPQYDGSVAIPASGGDGVGFMRFIGNGQAAARLRNPALISAARPLKVSFFANQVVSFGHWWAVVITAAETAVGADIVGGECPHPERDSCNLRLGSGLDFVLVSYGGYSSSYFSCPNGTWSPSDKIDVFRRSALEGNTEDSKLVLPAPDPTHPERLRAFELVLWPNRIEALIDRDGDGAAESLLKSFVVTIPWDEVSLHFVGNAQGGLPIDDGCDYFGDDRFIAWRSLRVSSVKYQRVVGLREAEWTRTDVRDMEHVGFVDGYPQYPQPNAENFDAHRSGVACSGNGAGFCSPAVASKRLLLAQEVNRQGLAAAALVYDIRGMGGIGLKVNGHDAGPLLGAASAFENPATRDSDWARLWVRRSVRLQPEWLLEKDNVFDLSLEGDVDIDRIELELAY